MRLHANPSIRTLARPSTGGLILATLLALFVSPQELLAQEALRFHEPLTPANGHLVEESPGLMGVRFKGGYGVPRGTLGQQNNSTYCDFGTAGITAAYCEDGDGNRIWLGGLEAIRGQNANGNVGALGDDDDAVYGQNDNGNQGSLGTDLFGVFGRHFNTNNRGYLGGSAYGVYGYHQSSLNYGYIGSSDYGVYGFYYIMGTSANRGSLGGSYYGVNGWNVNENRGYLGHDLYGVWGTGTPWAGYFEGNVRVTGTLTEGAAAFKVDHPLDPENRYLSHSAVESPDMMNVYNGNTTTDARGEAVVALPSYFEALNRDFRYQLTAVGAPGPNLYIAEKIAGNRFKIAGGTPGMEVSWQVTGIRHDAWAEANRLVVEEAKPSEERGYYLHPGLYGQPDERSVAWVRDPEGMRAAEERPARLEAEHRRVEAERQRFEEEQERIQQQHERLREIRGQQ